MEKEPPCNTCHPGVHKFNRLAHQVYLGCCDQYRMGPTGIMGLEIKAAEAVMNWLGVKNKWRLPLWDRVTIIVDALIAECRMEAEKKAAEKKQRGR